MTVGSSSAPPPGASTIGRDLTNVPFGELVQKLGLAIAEAQFELDRTSVRIAQLMAGLTEDENGNLSKDDQVLIALSTDANDRKYSLLELGFVPTFYQFVDTIIEVKISITVQQTDETIIKNKERQGTQGAWQRFWTKKPVKSSVVNAKYASKYQYSAEGSSLIRTKLATVPPPAVFEERLRRLMENDFKTGASSSSGGGSGSGSGSGGGV